MKYCTECGNELRDSAKFCVSCGTKVELMDRVENTFVNVVEEEGASSAVVEETGSILGGLSLDDAEHYLLEYLGFMKDVLLSPSSIFSKENEIWIFGLVNLVLYSIVLALNTYGKFFTSFFEMFVLQAAFVAVLFTVNKFIVKGTDSIFDALGKYGGLASGQIILFFLIWLLGVDSDFGSLLSLIASINQLLIFNMYIFESQTNEEGRVDNYYQLILSYIPFVIVMALVINIIL